MLHDDPGDETSHGEEDAARPPDLDRRRRQSLERTKVGSWIWDPATDAVWVSDQQARNLGLGPDLDRDTLTLEDLLDSLHPDDRPGMEEVLQEALEEAEYPGHEFRVLDPDGSVRWLEDRGEVETEEGDVVRVVGTSQDVTQRKKLEDELRERKERLREAQDIAGLGLVQARPGPVEDIWSEGLYQILGVEPGDVEPTLEGFLEHVHPEDRDQMGQAGKAALEEGEESAVTYRLVRPDGEVRHVDTRLRVEEGDDPGDRRVYATVLDITERARLEADLRDREDRLKEAQRVARVGSWEWHVPSDTVTWSDQTYRLYGLEPGDPEELTIEDVMDVVHPEDRSHLEGLLEEAMETGEFPAFEFRVRHPDGTVRWMEARGEVEGAGEDATLMRGTVLDVTERKELEDELREAKEAAQAASEAKSRFLANTSHEIRTPMNAVMGLTNLLLDTDLEPDTRDQLETIHASGEHLLSIVSDVLDLSKIEAGELTLEEEDFDLRQTVEEAFSLVDTLAGEKGLTLAYRYGDDVPEAIRGDQQRLRQVLVNLLSNAVKFTGEGEVTVDVAGRAGDGSGERHVLAFEVADTGKGISEEELADLFDPFTQVDASGTREHEGTGLGLAISKDLVEMMGGDIEAESTPGEGTTFRFTVEAEPADEAPERPWFSPAEDLEGVRVHVVDDNETNRRIVREKLTRWGVEVADSATPEEALEVHSRDPDVDLVLLDYDMPGMTGVEVAEALRDDHGLEDLPVILSTSMPEMRQKARDSPVEFVDVLVKPVSPSDLYEAATRALGLSEASVGEEPEIFDETLGDELELDILVAEDNAVNRDVLDRMLDRFGFEADHAEDGEEALEALRERPYDIVFMDVQMPRMGGIEATRRIREALPGDRQPRIVALTAHAAPEDRERCLEAGMDGYVSKPVSPRSLGAALAGASDVEVGG